MLPEHPLHVPERLPGVGLAPSVPGSTWKDGDFVFDETILDALIDSAAVLRVCACTDELPDSVIQDTILRWQRDDVPVPNYERIPNSRAAALNQNA